MKLPASKIEGAAAKKDVRAYLNNVYFERAPEGDLLIATDGHALACVPVECDGDDTQGYLTAEAITAARKAARSNKADHATIQPSGAQTIPCGPSFPRPTREDVGTFPDWRRIVPKHSEHAKPDFAIDAAILLRCAQAIGTATQIAIYLPRNPDGTIDPNSAIRIEPIKGEPGAFGVVMPCRM